MNCNGCPYITNQKKPVIECYCKKLGDKIIYYGCCEEDYMSNSKKESYQNPSKLNRYDRNAKYKEKLKHLAYDTKRWWPSAAYAVDSNGRWTDNEDEARYIKRVYRANHAPGYNGFLKKLASRKFRRYKGELPNGCGYKKTFDLWWELY